jgi:hypothetical protein
VRGWLSLDASGQRPLAAADDGSAGTGALSPAVAAALLRLASAPGLAPLPAPGGLAPAGVPIALAGPVLLVRHLTTAYTTRLS